MTEERIINVEKLRSVIKESRVGMFYADVSKRVRKFFTKRDPNAIKIPTIPRPLPIMGKTARSAPLLANNSLAYVILSDLYGLREKEETLDLNSIIRIAEKKNMVAPSTLPLTADSLKLFGNSHFACDQEFMTVYYMREFSGDYNPKHLLNKFIINETMFRRPDKCLWIYNDSNLGSGLKFYRIKIRRNIDDLNEVVLGKDLFVDALEASNIQLESAVEYNADIRQLLTGERTRIGSRMNYNPHISPSTSDFSPIKEKKVKDENENENENDIVEDDTVLGENPFAAVENPLVGVEAKDTLTLGEFDGIEGGPSKVKKLEAEKYESSSNDSDTADSDDENAEDDENGAEKT